MRSPANCTHWRLVVAAFLLAAVTGCMPAYVDRLANDTFPHQWSMDNPPDLDRLLKNGTDREKLFVLLRTHSQIVRECISEQISDPASFKDGEALRGEADKLVIIYGELATAMVFVHRGDKFAFTIFLHMLKDMENGPKNSIELARRIGGLGYLLQEITERVFQGSHELEQWIREELPNMEFDLTAKSPKYLLPQLKPISK